MPKGERKAESALLSGSKHKFRQNLLVFSPDIQILQVDWLNSIKIMSIGIKDVVAITGSPGLYQILKADDKAIVIE